MLLTMSDDLTTAIPDVLKQVKSVERKELEIFTGRDVNHSLMVNGSSKKCNFFFFSLCGILLCIKLNKSMILKA